MSDHPTLDEILEFVRGDLRPGRASVLLRHLIRACPTCSARSAPPIGVVPASDEAYDRAIDRAYAAAIEMHRQRERERKGARQLVDLLERSGEEAFEALFPADCSLPLVEALLARSWELRHEDPRRMRDLTHFATLAADRLSLARYGEAPVADVRCRAWAEYANACRVMDRLEEAEAAFQTAYVQQREGSGDPLLTAQLMDLHSSLCRARRKFGKARELLVLVYRIYDRLGQKHYAGRALLSMGICTGYGGQPERALRLLERGLRLVDEQFDPEIVSIAVHNRLWFTVDCGRFEEAQKLLFLNRWRYEGAPRLQRVKLRWLEARINAGLGRHERAAGMFREVRDELHAAGQSFDSALAALDMALSRMRQGREAEARDVVLEAVETFRQLQLEQEMMTATLFLHQVFALGVARATLLEDVIAFLRRAEHDPEVTFEPRG